MSEELHLQTSVIKISIIEDSDIHREWLKTELSDYENLKVVSADISGRSGIESVKHHRSDLVILDFQLEDMTGLEVSRRLKAYDEKIKIFFVTAHTEISIIERIVNDKGVDAIAVKGSPYFENNLITAINSVVDGGAYLDPSLLRKFRESKNENGLSKLTRREFEVFIQINTGKDDEKIAEDLFVETSHVKNIKSKIFKKIKNDDVDNVLVKLIQNMNPDKK